MNIKWTGTPSEAEMEEAWKRRDKEYDGLFCFGVRTTGVACRPSCPSQPHREHLEFFRSLSEALEAGYRPCKRCQPELVDGRPPAWIAPLLERVDQNTNARISATDLREMGLTPERVRRWFQRQYGMTFAAWCRDRRLTAAMSSLQQGAPLDDVILGHGFESHSGFREAFRRAFHRPPGLGRTGDCVQVSLIETPLGPMLAAATVSALVWLEFADRGGLVRAHDKFTRLFGLPVLAGENAVLKQAKSELNEYFVGTRRDFAVSFRLQGTPFQKRVWNELVKVPYGKTASYAEIAARAGCPGSFRAVARANASNRICILVPCHRVIAADGSLSGYGGGVWRKRLLLELECGKRANRP